MQSASEKPLWAVRNRWSAKKPDPPAQPFNTLAAFTSGGDGGYEINNGESYHDWDCLWMTTCDEGEQWVQTTVTGAGTLKFRWKVSSEASDELQFWIDDEAQDAISGEEDWAEKTYTITGTGTHTLKWRYSKDEEDSEGDDWGYVDWVRWSGTRTEPDPNDWSQVNYVYDAAGRRIEKKYDGRTVLKYVYDGDSCIGASRVSPQINN